MHIVLVGLGPDMNLRNFRQKVGSDEVNVCSIYTSLVPDLFNAREKKRSGSLGTRLQYTSWHVSQQWLYFN